MGPEDNPADDVQPTKEEWDKYEQERPSVCAICRRPAPQDRNLCLSCVPVDARLHERSTISKLVFERDKIAAELESTADKLSDCWLFLDEIARSHCLAAPHKIAEEILRRQKAPGWK